ncbi:hypothetical protein HanRHA438_Chr02g0048411 [Helianthus annuus]|nr:hypothetical protein HanRHA438_Chr02g0048411 [Helianthus annuus]
MFQIWIATFLRGVIRLDQKHGKTKAKYILLRRLDLDVLPLDVLPLDVLQSVNASSIS